MTRPPATGHLRVRYSSPRPAYAGLDDAAPHYQAGHAVAALPGGRLARAAAAARLGHPRAAVRQVGAGVGALVVAAAIVAREQQQRACAAEMRRGAAEVQRRCSGGAAEVQWRCSRGAAGVQQRCSGGAAEVRAAGWSSSSVPLSSPAVVTASAMPPIASSSCRSVSPYAPRRAEAPPNLFWWLPTWWRGARNPHLGRALRRAPEAAASVRAARAALRGAWERPEARDALGRRM